MARQPACTRLWRGKPVRRGPLALLRAGEGQRAGSKERKREETVDGASRRRGYGWFVQSRCDRRRGPAVVPQSLARRTLADPELLHNVGETQGPGRGEQESVDLADLARQVQLLGLPGKSSTHSAWNAFRARVAAGKTAGEGKAISIVWSDNGPGA